MTIKAQIEASNIRPSQSFLRDWYEREAERNDQVNIYRVPHAKRRMQTVADLLAPLVDGGRVLDIGCGMGMYCAICVQHGAKEVVGVDIAQVNIDKAEQLCADLNEVSFVRASWDQLPDDLTGFDIVLATEVLEHAVYPERVARQCLERGKHVVASSPISEPHWPNPFEVQGHLHSFRRLTFEALFDTARYSFTDDLYCYVVATTEQ